MDGSGPWQALQVQAAHAVDAPSSGAGGAKGPPRMPPAASAAPSAGAGDAAGGTAVAVEAAE
eukprot:7493841-Alexandrium_andersonii.AAC.1